MALAAAKPGLRWTRQFRRAQETPDDFYEPPLEALDEMNVPTSPSSPNTAPSA